MTQRQKYLRILSAILPAGVVWVSLQLGAAASGMATEDPAGLQPRPAGRPGVAARLAAIRQTVSEVSGGAREDAEDGRQLAWWGNWRNGGGSVGAWRNGGWRNGGWRNGGWRNGGWRNGPWPNFWRNW